jgi:hypothetical protein
VPLLKSQLEEAKSELNTQFEANAALEAQAEQLRYVCKYCYKL